MRTTWRPPVKPPVGAAYIDWSHPLARGPVWFLNEGAGATVRSIGQPWDLTIETPTTITWGASPAGLGLNCDGSISSRVRGTNVVSGPPFTLVAAFLSSATSLSFVGGIVSLSGLGASNLATIYMKTDFTVQFLVADTLGGSISITTSATYNDGRLHTAVAVAVTDSDWRLYVDGVLVGSSTATSNSFSWDRTLLGLDSANNGQSFKGSIVYAGVAPVGLPSLGTLAPANPYAFLRPLVRRTYHIPTSTAVTGGDYFRRRQMVLA